MFAPLEAPNFGAAAHALVQGLRRQELVEQRVTLLNDVNQCLGDRWHPFFIKLLMVVGEGAPLCDKVLLAESLVQAMQRGRAPGGSLNAWGVPSQLASVVGQLGEGFLRMAVRRTLDPLAYVCAWHSQSSNRDPLPQDSFERTLRVLLELFSSTTWCASVYQAKLMADVAGSTEGTFTNLSRLRVLTLSRLWSQGHLPLAQIALAVARTDLEMASVQAAVRGWRPL